MVLHLDVLHLDFLIPQLPVELPHLVQLHNSLRHQKVSMCSITTLADPGSSVPLYIYWYIETGVFCLFYVHT